MPHPEARKKRVATKFQWFRETKNKPCVDCGGTFPDFCMDYHHLDPETKETRIRDYINGDYSFKRIQEEVDKCVLLCANCHRIRHHVVIS